MTVSQLVTKLNLPQITIAAINNLALPENHIDLKASFFLKTSLFRNFAASDPDGLSVLLLYLHWTLDTQKMYERLGIPQQYFWDSMKDLTIWCEDYIEKHRVPGFKEWEWVGRSLRLEVIRIGRLQFEPITLNQTLRLEENVYQYGTLMLDVHIPAGEPLILQDALDAMNRAPDFFKTYLGTSVTLLHCHSWLLSPVLKKLLPEYSRIVQFQNLFTVYKTDNEERQAEERIFGFLSDNPHNYPETTSLQKAVKEYLLVGKEVMMGAGIRRIN